MDSTGRLVRLIPNSETDAEQASIKSLFNYRLSSDPSQARTEWLDIVEGGHALWTDISSEKRELIRSIFNHMNMEIVRRARPSSVFNFAKASIGNLFLTGYVDVYGYVYVFVFTILYGLGTFASPLERGKGTGRTACNGRDDCLGFF